MRLAALLPGLAVDSGISAIANNFLTYIRRTGRWSVRPGGSRGPAPVFRARASRGGPIFCQRAQVFIQARADRCNRLVHVGRTQKIARQCFVDVLPDRRDLRL